MQLSVETSGSDAIAIDLRDYPAKVTRATVRALNRAIASGRTVMVREIARDTGLRSKDVRDAMVMREASAARPEARLAARLKRIPLIDFRARGPEPSRGRGKGVTYRLSGGRGRIESAFIATMKSGHRGVFRRKGKERLGIIELYGPSLGQVFRKYRAQGMARAQEMFEKNFDHELGFVKGLFSVDAD
jgi:hypothetical protein